MTYADVAIYAVLAFGAGFAVGVAWGAILGFIRGVLN